jgi:hypothetical protein
VAARGPYLGLDAVAERLAKVSTYAAPSKADAVHRAKQYVKQLYRSLADQGLREANDCSERAGDFGCSASRDLLPDLSRSDRSVGACTDTTAASR